MLQYNVATGTGKEVKRLDALLDNGPQLSLGFRPTLQDALRQQGRLLLEVVEHGLDRFALQRWQAREDFADRLGVVDQDKEGVFQRGDGFGFVLRDTFRSDLSDGGCPSRHNKIRLADCKTSDRLGRPFADALGLGTSDARARAGTASTGPFSSHGRGRM